MLIIRQAKYEDIPRIMRFIDENWAKGHIMGNNRRLFEWQHVENDQVHYVIAEDDEDGKLYGTMGFIPMNHLEHPTSSTVMIRSLPHPEDSMLGESMARFFENNITTWNVISVGVQERYARTIDGIEEGHIFKMKHFYRLNNTRSDYSIPLVHQKEILPVGGEKLLYEIQSYDEFAKYFDNEELFKYIPFRDMSYIQHRYFEHPYYQYRCYQISDVSTRKKAVFFARIIQAQQGQMLRIVDYIGSDQELCELGPALDDLMGRENLEYIDFWCYGISDAIMKQGGFSLCDEKVVIPNFFEPFEPRDSNLYFYTWFMVDGLHVYKAFGDQDRPNVL